MRESTVSGNTSQAHHQSTLAAENLNRPSLHVLYVVGLNQLQTTWLKFVIHSNDITYICKKLNKKVYR